MANNRSRDSLSKAVRSGHNQHDLEKGLRIPAGIYRGIVVDTFDPNREGRVKVHVMKFYGVSPLTNISQSQNGDEYIGAMWCHQLLPFGQTSGMGDGDGQTTSGFHGMPPSVDNEVLVSFGSDSAAGVVIGMLPVPAKRAGIAGAGLTGLTNTGETTIALETNQSAPNPNVPPPEHPQAERLRVQGLDRDILRGQNFSSPARDPSPRTMGLSSPSGHAITMDDGSLEDGDQLMMRFRTAGGAQILMDDTNGFTYINNRDGSAWLEMNRNGDVDVFSGGSINFHASGDMNYQCGGSFNLQAGGGINMRALGSVAIEAAGGSVNIKGAGDLNLQADGNGNLLVGGNYRETAGRIDMNGPSASAATLPTATQLVGNTNTTASIAGRVPEAEPWLGHLDVVQLNTNGSGNADLAAESSSHYYGTPADNFNETGQTGEFNGENYIPPPAGTYPRLSFASNVKFPIDPELLRMADRVAQEKGVNFTIISGYRSAKYNATLRAAAQRSQHIQGKAIDISGSGLSNQDRLDIIAIASRVGVTGIGVYNSGSLHFDSRGGANAGWGSKVPGTNRRALPAYAVTTINRHRAGGF
jgi:hypothetical protein